MFKVLTAIALLLSASLRGFGREPHRPKLVVGIVVDQMRWDYLYRFGERYGSGGFNRLITKGFNCQNTMINYLPSFTAPGHASIYTGTVPALHGIVANDWIDNKRGADVYCTDDKSVTGVGGGAPGKMSPANMRATTITDELRLATNFEARVFGISLKDRGSILPAGHSANAAYWYDDDNGCFISSSYYMDQLPEWVIRFNARKLPDSLLRQDWHTMWPIPSYHASAPDNNSYEGVSDLDRLPVFPHHTAAAWCNGDYGAIKSTPFGNTLVRMMAEACIQNEGLGHDAVTDFLAVSFSATDYVGHQYGPNSIEVEDVYLRLDRELAAFLDFLDKTVGPDQYLLFLTADHGAAHNARFLNDHGIPANGFSIEEMSAELNDFLNAKYQDSTLVRSLINYQVFLNEPVVQQRGLDRSELRRDIIGWFREQEGVGYVFDLERPEQNTIPNYLRERVIHGYYPGRCGSIQLLFEPGWYSAYGSTGTTHGSWHPYDTHIPLLWYGWHVSPGETFTEHYITDIAATLAALLHIEKPNASIGKVIEPLLRDK